MIIGDYDDCKATVVKFIIDACAAINGDCCTL